MNAVAESLLGRLAPFRPPRINYGELQAMTQRLADKRMHGPAPVLALSGIDGSGKSHIAGRLASALEREGLRVALVGIDPWQRPREERIRELDPGAHFYRAALRWDEFFSRLVDPLVRDRGVDLEVDLIRNDDDTPYGHHYRHSDVNLVLLEGIFLFRRDFMHRYDLAVWVECSFGTALGRALARAQEGLSPSETAAEYRRVYFPAQRHHFALDAPARRAHAVLPNEEEG